MKREQRDGNRYESAKDHQQERLNKQFSAFFAHFEYERRRVERYSFEFLRVGLDYETNSVTKTKLYSAKLNSGIVTRPSSSFSSSGALHAMETLEPSQQLADAGNGPWFEKSGQVCILVAGGAIDLDGDGGFKKEKDEDRHLLHRLLLWNWTHLITLLFSFVATWIHLSIIMFPSGPWFVLKLVLLRT